MSMWLFTQPSAAARAALIYITAGALIVIWTGVWYVYLHNNPPEANNVYYWCGGMLASGLSLLLIGFGIGKIGRAARHADAATPVVPSLTANPQTTAVVRPVNTAETVVAPGRQTGVNV
jgi:hypothetical protein